jgi:hypothetical protein
MLWLRREDGLCRVAPHFEPRALTEIRFQPEDTELLTPEAFEAGWVALETRELSAEAEGPVQGEAEAELLKRLEAALRFALGELAPDEILVVENRLREDWPRTREQRRDVIVEGENRFHFQWRVDPPLRLARYRERVR